MVVLCVVFVYGCNTEEEVSNGNIETGEAGNEVNVSNDDEENKHDLESNGISNDSEGENDEDFEEDPLVYNHHEDLFQLRFSEKWEGQYEAVEMGMQDVDFFNEPYEKVAFEFVYEDERIEGEELFSIKIVDEEISQQSWYESELWENCWEYLGTSNEKTYTYDKLCSDPSEFFLNNSDAAEVAYGLRNDIPEMFDEGFELNGEFDRIELTDESFNEAEAREFFSSYVGVDEDRVSEFVHGDLTSSGQQNSVLFNFVYPTDPSDWNSNLMIFDEEGYPIFVTDMELMRHHSEDILDINIVHHPTYGDSLAIFTGHRTYHVSVFSFIETKNRFLSTGQFLDLLDYEFIDSNDDGSHDQVYVETIDIENGEAMAEAESYELMYHWDEEVESWVQEEAS